MKIEDKMADDVQDTEMTVDDGFVPEYNNESCCLSITNVPNNVFENQDLKIEFSQLFLAFDEAATISYLKSFRRVRVTFSSSELASEAKLVLQGCKYRGSELGVYFVQSPCSSGGESSQLKPPPLTKQFLISPPSSPPVGWEQTHEASPIINYDLLTAVATLDKSEPYELHPPDTDAPSIVVHLCDDDDEEVEVMDDDGEKPFHPLKCLPREVVQTRRPDSS